jgi:hypothetical protein
MDSTGDILGNQRRAPGFGRQVAIDHRVGAGCQLLWAERATREMEGCKSGGLSGLNVLVVVEVELGFRWKAERKLPSPSSR